jgi:hypothetical protein
MTSRNLARTAPVGALLLAGFVAGCGEDETTASDPGTDGATAEEAAETLSYEDVSDDLATRAGEELTVSATVDEVITQGVFAVTGPGSDPESIVVVDADPGAALEPGTEVVVTGTAHEELDDLEVEEILEVQLEDELLNDWEDEAYLEADRVETEAGNA